MRKRQYRFSSQAKSTRRGRLKIADLNSVTKKADKVKAKAKGNVEILGYQEDSVLRSYLQRAKGFVFAALEDFGILPVEAQGCGTPVIAFGRGGACETVVERWVSPPPPPPQKNKNK